MLSLHPLNGLGEVLPGNDLAIELAAAIEAGFGCPQVGDIIVVTQKIVSKAEGCLIELAAIEPSGNAARLAQRTGKDPRLVQIILDEASEVVRAVRGVLITRHRLGFVMANSGVDQSNIGPGGPDRVLLLPRDPDASARILRAALIARFGIQVAVVITDSLGRAWREGILPVAIGAAGLLALHDRRGDRDRDGRVLNVTQAAIADMVAASAGLVMGEGAESIPAVLLRGLVLPAGERPAADLVRPLAADLFR